MNNLYKYARYLRGEEDTGIRTTRLVKREHDEFKKASKQKMDKGYIMAMDPEFLRKIEAVRKKHDIPKLESDKDEIIVGPESSLWHSYSAWRKENFDEKTDDDFTLDIIKILDLHKLEADYFFTIESMVLYNEFSHLPAGPFLDDIGGPSTDMDFEWRIFSMNGPIGREECELFLKRKPYYHFFAGKSTVEALGGKADGFSFSKGRSTNVLHFRIIYPGDPILTDNTKIDKLYADLISQTSINHFKSFKPIKDIKDKFENFIEFYNLGKVKAWEKEKHKGKHSQDNMEFQDRVKNRDALIAAKVTSDFATPAEEKRKENKIKKDREQIKKYQNRY